MEQELVRIFLERLDGVTELQLLHSIAFVQSGGIPSRIVFPDGRYANHVGETGKGYLIYEEEKQERRLFR